MDDHEMLVSRTWRLTDFETLLCRAPARTKQRNIWTLKSKTSVINIFRYCLRLTTDKDKNYIFLSQRPLVGQDFLIIEA